MREKGQTEAAKTLETPVFSRGIEILTEKTKLLSESYYFSPSGKVKVSKLTDIIICPFQWHIMHNNFKKSGKKAAD